MPVNTERRGWFQRDYVTSKENQDLRPRTGSEVGIAEFQGTFVTSCD
jgi:hypothetical protein